jgi:hypothetical protein
VIVVSFKYDVGSVHDTLATAGSYTPRRAFMSTDL